MQFFRIKSTGANLWWSIDDCWTTNPAAAVRYNIENFAKAKAREFSGVKVERVAVTLRQAFAIADGDAHPWAL